MSREFFFTSKFVRSSVGKRVIDDKGCAGKVVAASQDRNDNHRFSIRFDDERHTIVDEKTCREYLLNYEKREKEMKGERTEPEPGVEVKDIQIYQPAMELAQVVDLFNRIARFTKEAMTPEIDFGHIPGIEKPTLLKPGSEKLCLWFSLEPEAEHRTKTDIHQNPKFGEVISVTARSVYRDKEGRVRGVYEANCNTAEDKYQHGGKWIPQWELPDDFDTEKAEVKTVPKKAGGTFKKYRLKDSANPWNFYNTVMKMAQKRADVGALLMATATSGIFSQDVEDFNNGEFGTKSKATEKKPESGTLNTQREKAHTLLTKCIKADTIKENDRKTWEDRISDAKNDKAIQAVISSLQTFADQTEAAGRRD